MLAVAEAQHIVLRYARPLPPEPLAVGPDLLGLALAEPVQAERDSPPFDKSMVDGYALALGPGQTSRFLVVEEVMAGQVPSRLLGPGEACRIMTGAPVPAGTSAVVMVEQTESVGDEVLVQTAVRPGQNILKQASEMSS
ncbi:MAG TPA: hypothetical protein PKC45_17285, partial [Gemmatales bacterium]|nr:hypothetical protein [Gemmatales bacterium]